MQEWKISLEVDNILINIKYQKQTFTLILTSYTFFHIYMISWKVISNYNYILYKPLITQYIFLDNSGLICKWVIGIKHTVKYTGLSKYQIPRKKFSFAFVWQINYLISIIIKYSFSLVHFSIASVLFCLDIFSI